MPEPTVTANGLVFTYLEAGPPEGPLALCLHGFPDTAHTWRHLLPALGEAGYHAVAPWLRGYAPTEIPADGRYQIGALVADACALHDALGGDSDAVVIGHDWGAFAAYGAAPYQPGRWRKVVTLAVPPLGASAKTFFTYDQLKRSFYVFLFQTALAEVALSIDDHSFLDRLWADWSPGYDAAWDLARVKEAIGQPENLSAAIGYYRAMFDPTRHHPDYADAQAASAQPPPQPALYLHGKQDGCLSVGGEGEALPFLAEGSVQVSVEGAGHFLHLDRPSVVNRHVLDFLAS